LPDLNRPPGEFLIATNARLAGSNHPPKPPWLRVRPPGGESYLRIKSLLRENGLHTVCEEAQCPNVGECWGGGTATFMLMGDTCTRGCRFCAVKTAKVGAPLDPDEPSKVAASIAALGLDYVVLTSVDRDDLPDQGAAHVAETIARLRASDPRLLVEVLIPDFQGRRDLLQTVVEAGPHVLAHNVETVARLTPTVRDARAGYRQSLSVLRMGKEIRPGQVTKSSLMVGLGETDDEVVAAMRDLREAGVDVLTIGQYLRPSAWHLPVDGYVPPERFRRYEEIGLSLGFAYVASGPLVRSSYRAGEYFLKSYLSQRTGAKA